MIAAEEIVYGNKLGATRVRSRINDLPVECLDAFFAWLLRRLGHYLIGIFYVHTCMQIISLDPKSKNPFMYQM